MTITLQEGRFYRTASGVKVGPMIEGSDGNFDGAGLNMIRSGTNERSSFGQRWTKDGSVFSINDGEEQDHIVSLWEEPAPEASPIQTVTKRVLNPGTYGRIKCDVGIKGKVVIGLLNKCNTSVKEASLDALELRSLAMVASQLAEFLERDEE